MAAHLGAAPLPDLLVADDAQHGAQTARLRPSQAQQRAHPQAAAAMAPVAMPLAARRAALAAMHAADPHPPQRRLPTRPAVVLAARLAAIGLPQCLTPPVASRQHRFGTGHGVHAAAEGGLPLGLGPEGGKVEWRAVCWPIEHTENMVALEVAIKAADEGQVTSRVRGADAILSA
jgi:hypothetical protein